MAKISTYSDDVTLSGADRLIGTDSNVSNETKNFTLSTLLDWVDENTGLDLANIGNGVDIYTERVGNDFELKSLVAGTNVAITTTSDEITISAAGAAGEINTASNLAGGVGIFAQKVLTDLEFKSLVAGTNISIVADDDTLTLSTTAEVNVIDSASSIGSGADVYKQVASKTAQFRSIKAGTDITVTENASDITIEFSGGGGRKFVSTATNFTVTDEDIVLGSGNIIVTLPSKASRIIGSDVKPLTIKNIGTGTVTLSETVEGSSQIFTGESFDIITEGVVWYII